MVDSCRSRDSRGWGLFVVLELALTIGLLLDVVCLPGLDPGRGHLEGTAPAG